jgi:hypothetical protein
MRGVLKCFLPAIAILLVLPAAARADFLLWDASTFIDGSTYDLPALPASVNAAGFNTATGLGSLVFSFNTAGTHYAGVYFYNFYDHGDGFDHSTAYGNAAGVAPAGVTWEMDWPGYLRPTAPPTVFDDFAANNLGSASGVPAYAPPPNACCSVAMAMIQSFSLSAGETATVTFTTNNTAPTGGFYLYEVDADASASLYLTQSLVKQGGGTPVVPEPAAVWLFGTLIGGSVLIARRRRVSANR